MRLTELASVHLLCLSSQQRNFQVILSRQIMQNRIQEHQVKRFILHTSHTCKTVKWVAGARAQSPTQDLKKRNIRPEIRRR